MPDHATMSGLSPSGLVLRPDSKLPINSDTEYSNFPLETLAEVQKLKPAGGIRPRIFGALLSLCVLVVTGGIMYASYQEPLDDIHKRRSTCPCLYVGVLQCGQGCP